MHGAAALATDRAHFSAWTNMFVTHFCCSAHHVAMHTTTKTCKDFEHTVLARSRSGSMCEAAAMATSHVHYRTITRKDSFHSVRSRFGSMREAAALATGHAHYHTDRPVERAAAAAVAQYPEPSVSTEDGNDDVEGEG
eukprot:1159411-Pelagomonas_calceolata.AAC.12